MVERNKKKGTIASARSFSLFYLGSIPNKLGICIGVKMRILIAEDDLDMQKILTLYLKKDGYDVFAVSDGKEAFDRLCQENYDLVIADWMMPHMNGIELCKEIRSYSIPVKIIMLTAKGQIEEEIMGLTCGADDYIRKPFEPKLVLLRIKKLLQIEEVLQCKDIKIDTKRQMVTLKGINLKLTQKEYALLILFIKNKGITLSREFLIDRIWGNDYDKDERTLDTHIRRLRSKIGKEYIKTYVGIGYGME